ncbi:unnamed protein product [Arctia plantaginis]|uniref:Uncharacterized protein n=1 Tax=Arctia plantaginis TaxID=874455 RepID=A0A8S0Z449_ARCPL|nr:unnamed protein product [Arctia plantaginis]
MLSRIAPKSLQEQQDLDDQWRCLPSYKQNTLDTNEPSDIFWHEVAQLQNKDGKKPFSTIFKKSFQPNKRHQNRQEE